MGYGKMRIVAITLILTVIPLVALSSRTAKGEYQTPHIVSNMAPDALQVSETYTVKQGDTLLGIAEQFINKNNYAMRELHEFAEGIKQANPRAFVNGNYIRSGEQLTIKYWIRRGN